MKRFTLPLLGALAVLGLQSGEAAIERLTLEQMVQKTDDGLYAEITASEVIRIDSEVDGPELYFTHLTLEGESLTTGLPETVIVTFPGGFVSETEGVWNSEAPSADDQKIGNKVVAFYKHLDNAGGGLECNFLYASHGGLYRTVEAPGQNGGTVVLGRGEGYAVDANITLESLTKAIETLSKPEEL